MASSDSEDYYYSDDDNEDYECADEDEDDGEDGGYGCSDGECPEEEEDDSNGDHAAHGTESPYVLEVEDDVRQRQDDAVTGISELLVVPPGYAAALLRRCQWDPEQLREEWFADNGRRICAAVGLPSGCGGAPTLLNDRDLTCAICFDAYGPGDMRSAACGDHFYCHECWRGYIRAAVGDGPRCLSLRCPDPECPAAVTRELVDDVVADEEDKQRYATFAVRSFVEEGKNKHVRWCPGAGCTLAVWSHVGLALYEVFCQCKHGFCFRCGEETHRPASCDTARAWMEKHGSDGETANWVLANTKHCPQCRRAIEKNQGCMHMTCGEPCRHEFCWLCLGPWEDHGRDYYSCNRYDRDKAKGKHTEANQRKRQAEASLERYLHYYERWTAYGDARRKARADLDGLEAGGIDEFADALGLPPTVMDFIRDAYAQVIECRRVLQWTYAYVYYMESSETDGLKRDLIDHIQSSAEQALEKLHDCAEKERQELTREAASGASAADKVKDKFEAYREKLAGLSGVMRHQFNKLVKGFEDGMAEIVA